MSFVEQPEPVAQALGVPLFKPNLYMPAYRAGRMGRWRLTHSGFGLDHGYYSGQWAVVGMPALLRDHQGEELTWMSLSPHEIESQELGCRYAYGHTVVMGLGMGWVAINIALNPAVKRVTVIELDPEVIELFDHSQAICGLPENISHKIQIVQADALQWQADSSVDFLYVDIWRGLEEQQTLDDVRRMQANVQAETIYFWGQELAIHALADHVGPWPQQVQRCVAETIALPLLTPADFDYPQMIADVVRLRRERKTPQGQMGNTSKISLRPITDDDLEFLFQLYASTREEEKALLAWEDAQWQAFLRQQFELQHAQYMHGYINPSFDLILVDGTPVGRLYVDRQAEELRIIDIALLPEYRRQGVGGTLLRGLLSEARASGRVAGLHVERDNPVLPFYERLGLQVVADKGVYLYMRAAPPEAGSFQQIPDMAGFAAHLHSDFAVQSADGTRAKLCLEQVISTRNGSCEGISLLFSGPVTLSPVHASYAVSHPVLGGFPLFLGPVLCRATGAVRYQAVLSSFNAN